MTRASLRSDPRLRERGRHRSPWNPRRLRPYAWYDAELGQPKHVGYVQLNGGSIDNISTPDSALNSFSNDIEVIMRVCPDDWTTGAIQTLVGKYLTTGNQRSWRFYVSAAGAIGLTASVDGTAVTTIAVTPTTSFVDATWIWLRLRLDLTNGANSVGTIDTAADTGNNYTIPTSWTTNGTNTGTTIAGVFNGTGAVEIGSFGNGVSERLAGRVGRCIVKAGFDGTTTSDFNADDCYADGYLHASGYVWTVGNPKIYDRSTNLWAPVVAAAGSNAPLPLPWKGINSLSASVSNYTAWVSGDVPARFTGDWSATWRGVRMVPDGSLRGIVRRTTGGPNGWELRWNTGGDLEMVIGDGVSYFAGAISSAGSVTAGSWGWFRIEFVKNEGGISKFKAWFAPDAPSEPATFTSLGVYSFPSVVSIDYTASAVVVLQPNTTAIPLSWLVLRNAGTAVATFDAALCSQTGITSDAQGNAWLITRTTSGRKTVVQSSAAASARTAWLFGTDDYATVPAAAVPPLAAAASATVVLVMRQHATPASNSVYYSNKVATDAPTGKGIVFNAAGTTLAVGTSIGDGTNGAAADSGTYLAGTRVVCCVAVAARSSAEIQLNSATPVSMSGIAAVGDATNATDGYIGRRGSSASGYQDFEFEVLLTFDRALSAAEIGQLVAYYRGGF